MAGGLVTYAWHSVTTDPLGGGGPVATPVSHAIFALAALLLVGFEARALRRRGQNQNQCAIDEDYSRSGGPYG